VRDTTELLTGIFAFGLPLLAATRICTSLKLIELGMPVTNFALLTMANLIGYELPRFRGLIPESEQKADHEWGFAHLSDLSFQPSRSRPRSNQCHLGSLIDFQSQLRLLEDTIELERER